MVTWDVPDWSIVAGNPARVIRKRFSDATCARLDALAWWDLPPEEVTTLIPLLASRDEEALIRALDKG